METKNPLLAENNNDNSANGELTDSRFPGFVGFCFVSDHDHYSLLG
jgi:hypothetical protein